MLIAMYLHNELSYDSHHKNGERCTSWGPAFVKEGKEDRTANTPAPMASHANGISLKLKRQQECVKTFAEDKTLLQYTDSKGNTKIF